jgi:hypothetical protein
MVVRGALAVALMVGAFLALPSVAAAENPLLDWVEPELVSVERRVRELDAVVGGAQSDMERGDLYLTFANGMLEAQVEMLRRLTVEGENADRCASYAASYPFGNDFGAGVDCQDTQRSLVADLETVYERLQEYALWMEHYHAAKDALGPRRAEIVLNGRAGPFRRLALDRIGDLRNQVAYLTGLYGG